MHPALRWPIALFATGYSVILLFSVFPHRWPIRDHFQKVARPWEQLSGVRQDWGMFHSIPAEHRVRFRVVLDDGREFGPITPGLETWKRYRGRGFYAVNRLLDEREDLEQRDAWLEKIGAEVEVRGGKSFRLRIERDVIRDLFHSRRDQILTKERVTELGPFPATSS
ncbi:MAG: hypothetical protein AAF191_04975 [Verrucomicrobiota bacterium]